MAAPLRIGLIGLDTSHVIRFAELLNDSSHPHHLPGARITAGFPGASDDFELSYSRVEGYTAQLQRDYGVAIHDSPAAVADSADLVFITSVDGRRHLGFLNDTLPARKPTFIDKPFATTSQDAETMFDLAKQAGVPLMSCSSMRYAANLVEARADESKGPLTGCDTFGPMSIEPTQPGLFFYGIHCVEMMVSVLGPACRRVQTLSNEGTDLVAAEWSDGRMAAYRGIRNGESPFGITLHRKEGFQFVDISANTRPNYAGMLEAILKSLPKGRSDVPEEDTLAVVRFIEAANQSRDTGQFVELKRA